MGWENGERNYESTHWPRNVEVNQAPSTRPLNQGIKIKICYHLQPSTRPWINGSRLIPLKSNTCLGNNNENRGEKFRVFIFSIVFLRLCFLTKLYKGNRSGLRCRHWNGYKTKPMSWMYEYLIGLEDAFDVVDRERIESAAIDLVSIDFELQWWFLL